MKEPDYQQRICRLEEALRESEKREASVQGRLEEAEVELRHTKAEVADLQIVVQNGRQDLRETKLQYEADRKMLISDHETTHKELMDVCNQLDIATRDLIDARKDKELLEVCYSICRSVRTIVCLCKCVQWILPVEPPNMTAAVVR